MEISSKSETLSGATVDRTSGPGGGGSQSVEVVGPSGIQADLRDQILVGKRLTKPTNSTNFSRPCFKNTLSTFSNI